jgi:hypothetical protein
MQDHLREQPGAGVSHNLVEEVCNVLGELAGTKDELRRAQPQHIKTMQCCMDFLIEAMQGPCPKNQEVVAERCAADAVQLSVCKFDIFTRAQQTSGGVSGRFSVIQLKATTMLMLLSMLEGRTDNYDVHNLLLQSVGAATLRLRIEQVHANVNAVDQHAKDVGKGCLPACCALGKKRRRREADMASLEEEHDMAFSEGFFLYAVALQLSSADPALLTKLQPASQADIRAEKQSGKTHRRKKIYSRAFKFIVTRIRVVEVCWGGSRHIDRIPFVMPEVDDVSEDRASQLLQQFDLGPTKQTEFIKLLPLLGDELEHLTSLSESRFFSFFKNHYASFKIAVYFLAIVLNSLALLFLTAKDVTEVDAQGTPTETLAFGRDINYHPAQTKRVMEVLTLVLALGYLLLIGYLLMSRAPLVTLKWRRAVRHAERQRRKEKLAAAAEKSAAAESKASPHSKAAESAGGGGGVTGAAGAAATSLLHSGGDAFDSATGCLRGPLGVLLALSLYLASVGVAFVVRRHYQGEETAAEPNASTKTGSLATSFYDSESWFWQLSLFFIGVTIVTGLRGDGSEASSGRFWLLDVYRVAYDIVFEPSTFGHLILLILALLGTTVRVVFAQHSLSRSPTHSRRCMSVRVCSPGVLLQLTFHCVCAFSNCSTTSCFRSCCSTWLCSARPAWMWCAP